MAAAVMVQSPERMTFDVVHADRVAVVYRWGEKEGGALHNASEEECSWT